MSILGNEMRTFLLQGWVKSEGKYYMLSKHRDWVETHDPGDWTYDSRTNCYTLSEELETLFVLRWS